MHTFLIPVMGTGFSADTPIRVAHLGVTSVISLVDDFMLERLRGHYCEQNGLACTPIPDNDPDARAKRITEYLDLVGLLVDRRMEEVRQEPFAPESEKTRYFELLPDTSPLREDYDRMLAETDPAAREQMAADLTRRMVPGQIEVNIMVKLDGTRFDADGKPRPDAFRDARAALRGYANSRIGGGIVFSAGINKGLFSDMADHPDFFRNSDGVRRKRIVVKVSDFRSARTQGRFLAKKGLEVDEYRIESGLNCGGHAFPTEGHTLRAALLEFQSGMEELAAECREMVKACYAEYGWPFPDAPERPRVTVQGGIGAGGEDRRLREYYGADLTGWGTPFLLVPETTRLHETDRLVLARAGEGELFLSQASPLGVPFNLLRGSTSHRGVQERAAGGKPGVGCTKGFLRFDGEFADPPICTASRTYQKRKLDQLEGMELSAEERSRARKSVTAKTCLCNDLANSALADLGLEPPGAPTCVCAGPNGRWFDRLYSLEEMVDHIYGRGPSLTPPERPHMFAQELALYVNVYLDRLRASDGSPRVKKGLAAFLTRLEEEMAALLELAGETPYPGENLASLPAAVAREKARIAAVTAELAGAAEEEPAGNAATPAM
ncbi:MAG: hypothetical protein ACLFRG_19895 [Desulfococcaceae bacterium]